MEPIRYTQFAPSGSGVKLMPNSLSPIDVFPDDGYIEIHAKDLYPALCKLAGFEEIEHANLSLDDYLDRVTSLLGDEARRQVTAYKKTEEGKKIVNRRLTPEDYLSIGRLFALQRKQGLADPKKWHTTIRTYMRNNT